MSQEIKISRDFFEHLLNCMANMEIRKDVNADGISEGVEVIRRVQAEGQAACDKAYHEARELFHRGIQPQDDTKVVTPVVLPDTQEEKELKKANNHLGDEVVFLRSEVDRLNILLGTEKHKDVHEIKALQKENGELKIAVKELEQQEVGRLASSNFQFQVSNQKLEKSLREMQETLEWLLDKQAFVDTDMAQEPSKRHIAYAVNWLGSVSKIKIGEGSTDMEAVRNAMSKSNKE